MIDNYADANVDETLEAVSSYSGEKLAEFIEYEREHKNRSGVVDELEAELVTVTPATTRRYIAGIWFDDLDDARRVRRTRRVENALENDELETTRG